jgi:segregation and condensation protein B
VSESENPTAENPAPEATPADAAPVATKQDAKAAARALENAAEPIPASMPAPAEDPELDEVEPANLEQPADEEPDTPFEKLASRARRFSADRVRTLLESILLVTDKPLTEEAIQQCTGLAVEVIKENLQKLQGHYRDGVCGIVLHEVAGGWQFRTDPHNSEFVRRFLKVKPQRLTRAALETLAIIAYRQPVTRPEIEDIRAVDSGAVLKALLERHLVKIIGKKEEPGRPLLYGTTPEFLEFFNLRDLGSLPTLREFQELSEESQAIVEKETGAPAPKPTTEGLVADLKDTGFEQKLQETTAEADAALADLETALADTDQKTKATERVINPQVPEGAPVPGAAPTNEDEEPPPGD